MKKTNKLPKFSAVIIVTDRNQLALQKRDSKPNIANPGKVTVFAGAADKRERPIDCARREIKEELGLPIKRADLRFLGKWISNSIFWKKKLQGYVYVLNNIDPNNLKLSEGEKIIYIKKNKMELVKLDMPDFSKKVLLKYLEKGD
ncbi:hypothetical protein A3H03_03665 [Candidatus Kuenenbacteria bacterium RIFCSPLOWO2_12_FULL_42_13]|uniref:Protein-tyrosine-phosphatase n=5 Tax=Candidatus Kueneniibacteriota TaxID=1752740 RepID=A0A0G0Z446_9BACT|nr:MAG: Protein-tyrosine-phosphatase [Candidatus Kuenenbacteria bacterium GW2011_GWA2_42_15]OGG89563.1 MAG: hypothetical protein A3C68_01255 [Candidatus Kuenenbacteria bacterium RIFCSPHIGHO2_02_FULL_42_29]OGG90809.1 MAG: hypothetical protein A3H55_04035 [Candidatus Kuenenbacteria bacterium RIFCSPLOWO2_02_FULL_42_16]OGG92033.1 MAG: hypothetical protein A3H03_03665 [Candidatus Kuenenbacteria bacterium RIFCSPLOWO2_12_FULL_42_13]OGG95746.1 MAG: hypothetical protein A2V95_02960 [Candidatus Kuenenbac